MCHNECDPREGKSDVLYLTMEAGMNCRESEMKNYSLYCMGRRESELLYQIYKERRDFSSPISGGLPGAAFGLRGEKTDFPAIAHSYGFWNIEYYGGSVFRQAVL